MTIGARIRQVRDERGISRAELVRLSGVPYPTLAGLENGDQNSSTKLHALAQALGVSVRWLETGQGSRTDALLPLASQAVRLDPLMLSQTHEFLETAFALQGKQFDLQDNWDLFADAYDYLVEDDRPVDQRNLVDFGRWLAARQAKGDSDAESQRPAGEVAGTNRRRKA